MHHGSNPGSNPGLIVKLRPAGPWRSGPDSGARNRVDPIYHSDSLFAAVTAGMSKLDMRDAWLDAAARNPEGPAVRFSSCFPFLGETAFIVPPRSIWPPAAGVSAVKTRWKSARFIPLHLVAAVVGGSRCMKISGRWMARANACCRRDSRDHSAITCVGARPSIGLRAMPSDTRRPASNSAGMRDCGRSYRFPATRRMRAGLNQCAARSGCWRIPDSAESAPAVGGAARSPNLSKVSCLN